jgi:hypothetical protein
MNRASLQGKFSAWVIIIPEPATFAHSFVTASFFLCRRYKSCRSRLSAKGAF